ncbi:MAG: hypothetical protein KJO87_08575 [Acidimicrobiia bacterium]|nr:hypothetical protein [Acidimicrobiia bacterium]NNL69634.1 hypothetical protein [Acidimicrobiia bacterium]
MATDYVADHRARVVSTQDEARRAFAGTPLLVTATDQTGGRGRRGASWLNATRALAASLAFRPAWPDEQVPLVTLVAGLAAQRTLGSGLLLKWPNDLVRDDGRKVAGLLAERTADVVVMGMGVNLYWPDAPPGMAGLYADDPGDGVGTVLAESWARRLLEETAAGPGSWDPGAYIAVSATVGTTVTWDGGGPGDAIGVDDSGGLIVRTRDGSRVLRSGEVRTVRTTTLSEDSAGEG